MADNLGLAHRSTLRRAIAHPAFVIFLRLFLGGILLYAGGVKLIDMSGMADAIEKYRILPRFLVNIAAIVMPAVEVVSGACLIAGVWMDGALLIVTGLFVLFIAAVESAILRELNIECGCFGLSDSEVVGAKVLVRDGVFLIACVPIWISHYRIGECRDTAEETASAPSGSEV
jgi:putative oxidoreductase